MAGIQPESPARPSRLRPHLSITVHPVTPERLDELAAHFHTSKGRVVDTLVERMLSVVRRGKMFCLDGQVCRVGREDIGDIL